MTTSPGLIKFGLFSLELSKITLGVFPIIFHPPGLSKVYTFANCSVSPTEPFGTFTLGVSKRYARNSVSRSPKKGIPAIKPVM